MSEVETRDTEQTISMLSTLHSIAAIPSVVMHFKRDTIWFVSLFGQCTHIQKTGEIQEFSCGWSTLSLFDQTGVQAQNKYVEPSSLSEWGSYSRVSFPNVQDLWTEGTWRDSIWEWDGSGPCSRLNWCPCVTHTYIHLHNWIIHWLHCKSIGVLFRELVCSVQHQEDEGHQFFDGTPHQDCMFSFFTLQGIGEMKAGV